MIRERSRRRPLLLGLVLFGLVLTGCANTVSGDAEREQDPTRVSDPLEPINRVIFGFNQVADAALIRPVAIVYQAAVPREGRDTVRNFLRNLSAPVVLANDIFQGEFRRARTTTVRFVLNTTIGLAGLFDVATGLGHEYHNEDFGQTLGALGVGDGIYLMLPIFGPSNARDLFGRGVDFFLDPFNSWARNTDREGLTLARTVMEGLDFRARNIETLDDLEESSVDFYATVRSLYKQTRDADIRNGAPPPLPEISFDEAALWTKDLALVRSREWAWNTKDLVIVQLRE